MAVSLVLGDASIVLAQSFQDHPPNPAAVALNFPLEKADDPPLDLPLFEKASLSPRARHPLDIFSVLQQEVSASERFRDLSQLQIHILEPEKLEIATVDRLNPVYNSRSEIHFSLGIEGERFHDFFISSKSVARIGSFLVFVEKDNYRGDHQEVRFIDLGYFRSALGRTELPVFTMTVDAGGPLESIEAEAGLLRIKSTSKSVRVDSKILGLYSMMHQSVFNMAVALSDPKEVQRLQPLLDDFGVSLNRAVDLQGESLAEQLESIGSSSERFKKQFTNLSETLPKPGGLPATEVGELWKIQEITKSIGKNSVSQNRLMNRFRMLQGYLGAARPLGTPSLVKALHFVTWSLSKRANRAEYLKEGIRHLWNSKLARRAFLLTSVGAAALAYPEATGEVVLEVLNMAKTTIDIGLGKGIDILKLAQEAAITSVDSFGKFFTDILFSSAKFPRMMVGLTAMTGVLFGVLAVPHLMVQSFRLWRDFRGQWINFARSEEGFRSSFAEAFIEREKAIEKAYVEALSKAEMEEMGREGQKFSAKDEAEVRAVIRDLVEKDHKSPMFRFLDKTGLVKLTPVLETKTDREIDSFGEAVKHFLFGTAVLSSSAVAYAWGWSHWHIIRSYVWRPVLFTAYLTFPGFFHHARKGEFATVLNGGRGVVRGARSYWFFTDPEYLENLTRFENKILGVETEMQKQIMHRALQAMMRNAESSREVLDLFKTGVPSGVDDKRILELSAKQRSFFRHYFELYYEKSMRLFMEDLAEKSDVRIEPNQDLSVMKKALLDQADRIQITPEGAEDIVKKVNEAEVFTEARTLAEKTFRIKNFTVNMRHRLQSALSGKNNSITERMNVTERQSQKPKAVERAVRTMIAQNLVDKPLELVFNFLCFAAFTDGLLSPVQMEAYSDTSFAYLSRYLFLNQYIYGVVSGVLAGVWFKLQMDNFNDGKFKDVPAGEDAKRGWLSWQFKQTFKNPENKYLKNYANSVKMVFWNMPAAFTQILAMGLLTMGRFDLDIYVTSYLALYLVPWGALGNKLDQGFEFASKYYAKDVPEHLRAHPLAQKYLSRKLMVMRLLTNLPLKIYENVEANFTAALTTMTTTLFGTRSLSRILGGGETFTQHAVNAIEAAKESVKQIPGAEKVLNLCRHVLTNKNVDWQ